MNDTIKLFGCGNIGKRVARLFLNQGARLSTTVYSHASQLSCNKLGLSCEILDLDQPFALNGIENHTRILYTIPPPRTGISDTRLAALLEAMDPTPINKFVLISTTGVYGDCAGDWVNENTPIKPEANRARRRADAEQQLQAWALRHHVDYLILRVPGIYSLDRLPLKRLQAGTPMIRRELAPWTNRIHADDLANACYAALGKEIKNEIINIADDKPTRMSDYFDAVADYAGLPRPPQISLEQTRKSLSAGMLSYLTESRRIENQKMKTLLDTKLQYPSLADALNTPGEMLNRQGSTQSGYK